MSERFPVVALGEVVLPIKRAEVPSVGTTYRQIGVKLWGRGAYERESIDGSQTKYKTLSRVVADDIIVNKIWARNGSVAVVPESLAGCYVSSEFPTFVPIQEKLSPRWVHWLTKTNDFWKQCDEKSQGTSGKNRIRPEKFLEIEIPLPPLEEQGRIVARIEELAAKIDEARTLKQLIEKELYQMLLSVFNNLIAGAEFQSMGEIAPITRRKIEVEIDGNYSELGVRSFGKGTFHKPTLSGLDVGSKKLYRIESGDLVFSNVFAWEGAVAVAKPKDNNRVGSHRFITCVPKESLASAMFLCFYFLTDEGLEKLGEASPGGAGRNRTLGLKSLEKTEVPIPRYERQIWFDDLQAMVDDTRRFIVETTSELDALLLAVLDKAFKGKLK